MQRSTHLPITGWNPGFVASIAKFEIRPNGSKMKSDVIPCVTKKGALRQAEQLVSQGFYVEVTDNDTFEILFRG